jgi:hypothetical protein
MDGRTEVKQYIPPSGGAGVYKLTGRLKLRLRGGNTAHLSLNNNQSKKNLHSNICSNPVLSLFDIFIAANSNLEFDTGLAQPGEEDNVFALVLMKLSYFHP